MKISKNFSFESYSCVLFITNGLKNLIEIKFQIKTKTYGKKTKSFSEILGLKLRSLRHVKDTVSALHHPALYEKVYRKCHDLYTGITN